VFEGNAAGSGQKVVGVVGGPGVLELIVAVGGGAAVAAEWSADYDAYFGSSAGSAAGVFAAAFDVGRSVVYVECSAADVERSVVDAECSAVDAGYSAVDVVVDGDDENHAAAVFSVDVLVLLVPSLGVVVAIPLPVKASTVVAALEMETPCALSVT